MIREAQISDLPAVLRIYETARLFMAANGNPTQWVDGYPQPEILQEDIAQKCLYVICDAQGIIHGVYAFRLGEDPSYASIENGTWLNQNPYGTIHRLAGDGSQKHLFSTCFQQCQTMIPNIRADTHPDNHIMQHLLEQHGFVRCGIIRCEWTGSLRIAYHFTGA